MHLPAKVWTCLTYLTDILSLSVVEQSGTQQPIGGHSIRVRPPTDDQISAQATADVGYLKFLPPSWRPLNKNDPQFFCEYPDFNKNEWESCTSPENRQCWIRHLTNGTQYNITTNYETEMPRGIVRNINLNISDDTINADGMDFPNGKVVNGKYPGPLIQACWGDTVNINVTNSMQFNGTAVHWHGIRQLHTMHMDGVPGITQCPIAPGDSFTYRWTARQYGTAWYHSHYSVQYADGLLGPLTIYGPHSANWDEGKYPLLMNDWFHNSAYSVIHGKTPGYPTVLLNGTGNILNYKYFKTGPVLGGASVPLSNSSVIPPTYRLHAKVAPEAPPRWPQVKPKRYLLRLVNTAFETGFVFSIDHHMLEVISADFVPIVPYNTTHLHIGIGQRYNVIVSAKANDYPDGTMAGQRKLFWIRTTASPCFLLQKQMPALQDYDRTGVFSYYEENGYEPVDSNGVLTLPDTKRWPQIDGDEFCRDEELEKLTPMFHWTIGEPDNMKTEVPRAPNGSMILPYTKIPGERLDVVGSFMWPKGDPNTPKFKPDFPVATFSFERVTEDSNSFDPMQITYQDPILLQLNASSYNPSWAVVNETQNITEESWIYLALGGRHPAAGNGGLQQTAGAHPIHFHGHDFAILQQESYLPLTDENIKIDWLTLQNPPRRDVVLLPANGFVIIAFKADNPGSWIMHCHIAFHASEGLALQVLERQHDAFNLWPGTDKASIEARRVCGNWDKFQGDCKRHWPGELKGFKCYPACNGGQNGCKNLLYDDSGI